jgi:4-amino-4-deoxy-L-arabinose transferase-like glycosyltransferase
MDQALAPAPTALHDRLHAWWRRHSLAAAAAVLLGAALLLRSAYFGSPLAGYDEQFYLLTGDRLLHGALPYVDIWDRKPPGLFLIYAGIRLLGGDGVLQYQLAATAFSAATAFVILLILRRHWQPRTALLCAGLYLVMLGVMGGEAGQSPLFYNLFVALAALLVLRAVPRLGAPDGIVLATAAMALCGLAMFVKTTALFEGGFLGLALLWGLHRAGRPLSQIAALALLFIAVALLPLLLAALVYWHLGQFDAFWFANFRSAMLRPGGVTPARLGQMAMTLAALGPVLLLALASFSPRLAAPQLPIWERRFMAGWLAAAAIGFVSVGYFFHHYALPLLVPLTITAARFLEGSSRRWLALALICFYPLVQQLLLARLLVRDDRAEIAALADAIPADVRTGCMFEFGGPPILYHLTNACLVTRYAFSDHLYAAEEAPAIGVDADAALDAAMARRPVIVVSDFASFPRNANARNVARMRMLLARDYRPIATRPYRYFENPLHQVTIWRRRG